MKVAVLVPCFKRPEYTAKCIAALESAQDYHDVDFFLVDDGSQDETAEILNRSPLNSTVTIRKFNQGLRLTILDFFDTVQRGSYDLIAKIDNDCAVPKGWLNAALAIFENYPVDILSPNVSPSNAAFTYGRKDPELPYMPAKVVGGLWIMRSRLLDTMLFERMEARGIRGAFSLLNQILVEKEPTVGWIPEVIVQDLGHWSGKHPEHIKTPEHEEYSAYVGRSISWGEQ